MNQFSTAAILTSLLLVSTNAGAQNAITNDTLTAGTLYQGCLASDALGSDDSLCNTYFRGLTDGLYIMQQMSRAQKPTCMPSTTAVSVADARRFFNRWMTQHAETAGNSAAVVAAMAVIGAFPCSR